jgi:hypothetical protein
MLVYSTSAPVRPPAYPRYRASWSTRTPRAVITETPMSIVSNKSERGSEVSTPTATSCTVAYSPHNTTVDGATLTMTTSFTDSDTTTASSFSSFVDTIYLTSTLTVLTIPSTQPQPSAASKRSAHPSLKLTPTSPRKDQVSPRLKKQTLKKSADQRVRSPERDHGRVALGWHRAQGLPQHGDPEAYPQFHRKTEERDHHAR